jgi:hypothetical protein
MGFDPRQWSAQPRSQHVTSNVEALLAENEALRREVRQLRRRLEHLERRTEPSPPWQRPHQPSGQPEPLVTAQQVVRWGELLAQQPGWSSLRAKGLEQLVETLNRQSFHPNLSLQQRLDRLLPGLGTDLLSAMAGPMGKKHWAVLAAFALYGVRTSEWLEEEPRRVVAELRQRMVRSSGGRRTRTDQRASDRNTSGHGSRQGRGAQSEVGARGKDARHLDDLAALGLQWGATREQIKQAHRRLVKRHHPDMGGTAADFHRINQAYQRLIA